MPRSKSKQTRRKRTRWESDEAFEARKRRKYQAMIVGPGRGPALTQQKVTFRYQDFIPLNPGTGGVTAVHIFSANGCYDPDITGIGHQPRGFDELMALYDHGVCIGSRIRIEVIAKGGETNSCTAGVAMRDFTTTDLANGYIEGGHCMYGIATPNRRVLTRVMAVDPNKFLGRSKPMADPHLKFSSSTNPTEGAFWHVFAAGGYAEDPGSYNINVLIEYECILVEPKVPTQS